MLVLLVSLTELVVELAGVRYGLIDCGISCLGSTCRCCVCYGTFVVQVLTDVTTCFCIQVNIKLIIRSMYAVLWGSTMIETS